MAVLAQAPVLRETTPERPTLLPSSSALSLIAEIRAADRNPEINHGAASMDMRFGTACAAK
jgi:hypothetical protein